MEGSGKDLTHLDLERRPDSHRLMTPLKGFDAEDESEEEDDSVSPSIRGRKQGQKVCMFICVQLPLIVFALTEGVAGLYCCSTESLVFKDGIKATDKDSLTAAARNQFRMVMMAVAGFAMTVSLSLTTVLTKGLDDGQLITFVTGVWRSWPRYHWKNKWDGRADGMAPTKRWYCDMIEDLDPNFETTLNKVAYIMLGRCKACWNSLPVKCLLHLIPLPLLLQPLWWWKRIFEYWKKDFHVQDFGDPFMQSVAPWMTVIFGVAALWQQFWYMYDEVYASRFAALEVRKIIEEATAQLKSGRIEATGGDLMLDGKPIEKHMNWIDKLGMVITMERELDKLWSSPLICVPWIALGLSGVAILWVGVITGQHAGFINNTGLSMMSRWYVLVGCAVILYVLLMLSTVSVAFCQLAGKAKDFHGLYLRKVSGLPAKEGWGSSGDTYLSSIEKFIDYINKDQIGARLLGIILISRSMAWRTLQIMIAGISFFSVVSSGVQEEMLTQLHDFREVGSNVTAATHRLRNVIRVVP